MKFTTSLTFIKSKSNLKDFFIIYTPILVGLFLGLQWVMAAFLIIGLHPRGRNLAQLTDPGKYWFRPEYDLGIYVVGCVTILVLSILLTRLFEKRLWIHQKKKQQEIVLAIELICLTGISFMVQMLLVIAFKNGVVNYWHQAVPYISKVAVTAIWLLVLLVPSLTAIFLSARKIGFNFPCLFSINIPKTQMSSKLVDLMMPVVLIAVLYVPNWRWIAGKAFQNDLFLHWDGFAMRIALSFKHGLILGKEIFLQYGIGWPVLLSYLNSGPLLYGQFMHIGIIVACVYYVGVYILLRLLTKHLSWSVAGIFGILYVQFFNRNWPDPFLWETPSSTILRSPVDIWILIALYLALSTRNRLWNYVAAFGIGVALFFSFDTGAYLLITFSILSIFLFLRQKRDRKKSEQSNGLVVFLHCLVITVVTVLTLMGGFGRFPISDLSAWRSLFEGFTEFGAGISNLPMAILKQNTALLLFEIIVGVYLAVVGKALISFIYRKDTNADLFAGTLSLYGLATLLIFVGRSHALNMIHPIIPFLILVVWAGAKLYEHISWSKQLDYVRIGIPVLVTLFILTALFSNPAFQNYPNVMQSFLHPQNTGECLMRQPSDICGLGIADKTEILQITSVVEQMKLWQTAQQRVALFDDQDALYYLLIESYPWFRYRPGEVFTTKQLREIENQLKSSKPDYILIRNFPRGDNDVIQKVIAVMSPYYQLEKDLGMFRVWKKQ